MKKCPQQQIQCWLLFSYCCGWADIECWIDLEIHQGRESKENMLSEKRLLLLQGNDMKSLSLLVGVSAVVWRCFGWVL
jgi:hypothetical protein